MTLVMLPLNSFLLICLLITCLIILVVRWFVDRKWWGQQQYLKVPELNEPTQQENPFYRRVWVYLNSLPALQDADLINILSGEKPNDIVLSLGARVSWVNRIERDDEKQKIVCRSLVLRMRRKDRQRILRPYLRHINAVCDEMEQMRNKELRRIHMMNKAGKWKSVRFDHPASFESLVMDPDLKSRIQLELETFQRSRQYYKRLGRVWKRSYLLYGPSGTGKSTFIAAVANFLNYDVYTVNLDDADLDSVLLRCACKSLIVVEDLDRYVKSRTTTSSSSSGLLNFMDGILNFGDERIMIFTATNKEGIESALLRPGRIDVHIHFPLICDFGSFKSLAGNYLGLKEHKLFPQLEEMFESGATMTPAEITELMLVNRNSPTRALRSVITALQCCRRSGSSKVVLPNLLPEDDDDASAAAPDWKETLPKEFRKLYGLLSLKTTKRPPASSSFDHQD